MPQELVGRWNIVLGPGKWDLVLALVDFPGDVERQVQLGLKQVVNPRDSSQDKRQTVQVNIDGMDRHGCSRTEWNLTGRVEGTGVRFTILHYCWGGRYGVLNFEE